MQKKRLRLQKKVSLGIKNKLLILFSVFVLIFYGTMLLLFLNTQRMMKISEQIVSKNYQVSTLSKALYESLLSMEANDKKYRLLNKEIYLNYFTQEQRNFENSLERILELDSAGFVVAAAWKDLDRSYRNQLENKSISFSRDNSVTEDSRSGSKTVNTGEGEIRVRPSWAPEEMVNRWFGDISKARMANDREIERALVTVNERGKLSVRNGLIGMAITFIAGLAAAFFLSRSIVTPLKQLKHALEKISSDKDSEEIDIKRNDEFGELANAFNDMSWQLKEEEELRSEFIATLSHEIRTPLASIRESVNMALEGVLGSINAKQIKFLEIARSEITRINDLLNHLLQVSHLDSESRRVTPVLIDPNKLAIDVSRGLVPSAKAKNVSLKLHKLTDPPVLIGVKKELQQVLFNIIDNAVKFSPKGGEVVISLSLNADNSMLIYRVSDQGPGISDKELALIFSKYYRAKNARNHMDGVGLGLFISKRIVQFHGGEIFTQNNEGGGCSFYCSLPCEVGQNGA